MSAQAAPFTFPAPIGGVPFDSDFAPSIIFAIAYGLLTILAIYRVLNPKSRTLCTLGSVGFVAERVAIYSLRAKQSHTPSEDNDTGLMKYWQTTYAIAHVTLLNDCTAILRSLLVNTTLATSPSSYPFTTFGTSSGSNESNDLLNRRGEQGLPQEDRPRARFWYRQIFGNLGLVAVVPIVLGIIQGVDYNQARTDASSATLVMALRYAATGMVFAHTLFIQGMAIRGYLKNPRIRRSGALTVAIICAFLDVVSIYRLAVMWFKTTALTSTEPQSMNTHAEKATFYIFQAAPEWLAAATIFAVNVREVFGTGLLGDYRIKDKKSAA